MQTYVGREKALFARLDWQSGEETVVVEHPRFDVRNVLAHPTIFDLEATSIVGARHDWLHVAPQVRADFEMIQNSLPGFEFNIVGQSDENRIWIVDAHKAEQALTTFLYDRDKGTMTELFRARPALEAYRLSLMRPVEGKSRDGLDLLSYLTLPAGITNLQTVLESMPPYWAGFADFMYRSYGDPKTEEGRALLAVRSPIHEVDRRVSH